MESMCGETAPDVPSVTGADSCTDEADTSLVWEKKFPSHDLGSRSGRLFLAFFLCKFATFH